MNMLTRALDIASDATAAHSQKALAEALGSAQAEVEYLRERIEEERRTLDEYRRQLAVAQEQGHDEAASIAGDRCLYHEGRLLLIEGDLSRAAREVKVVEEEIRRRADNKDT